MNISSGRFLAVLLSLFASQILATTAVGQSQPDDYGVNRHDAIVQLRTLCQSMSKDHISRQARDRAERFIRGTDLRLWEDTTGKFSTRASYIGHDKLANGNVQVTLRKTDGKNVALPLAQLSRGDQRLVSELATILSRIKEDATTYREQLARQAQAAGGGANTIPAGYGPTGLPLVSSGSSTAAYGVVNRNGTGARVSVNAGFGTVPFVPVAPLQPAFVPVASPYAFPYGNPYPYGQTYVGPAYFPPQYYYGRNRGGRGFYNGNRNRGYPYYNNVPGVRPGSGAPTQPAPAPTPPRRSTFTGGNVYGR